MTWRLAFILCAAGALRAQEQQVDKVITDAFERVAHLKPMEAGRTYTLTAGGKAMTGAPDDFVRRRTGAEILESGMTTGDADNALATLYLMDQHGYQTQFVDAVEISSRSLEYGLSGHASVAVHHPKYGEWMRVDPMRNEYSWPWTVGDKMFYGSYWIGFRGRIEDYPAHDPESLRKFYRDTLKRIPARELNQHLFRFQFTVDPSLIAPDGHYRNPNVAQLLRDNGKVLAARGVHPANAIAIRLTAGGDHPESRLAYSDQGGWVCTVGLQSALSVGFVSYLEGELNRVIEKGQPLHAMAEPGIPQGFLWAGGGILCVMLGVLLAHLRREAALAFWICQLLGWFGPFSLVLAKLPDRDLAMTAKVLAYSVCGILLTTVLRREIRRRGWLRLPVWRMVGRLGLSAVTLGAILTALDSVSDLIGHAYGKDWLQSPGDVVVVWVSSTVTLAIWSAFYVLLTGPRRHREAEVQLQLALREAELRALEAQINPHFLFNCLNSIRGLVAENPAMSQDMLTRLANILRYNLRRDVHHTVALCSEVEIVSDYLALESARYEDRLRVHLSIDPNAGEVQVPPMLLQTLVENALKHGIAPLPGGGDLLVRVAVAGDSIVIEVENPGQIAESRPEATQLGLANIRERLRILYQGRASLELKNRDGRVAATVLIPTIA